MTDDVNAISLLEPVKGLLEGLDKVTGVLDTAGHTDEPVGDADLLAVLLEHVSVGEHSGAGNDRLRRAQVLAQCPGALDRVHDLDTGLLPPLDLEPEHTTVDTVLVLPVRERLLLERLEARPHHLVDGGVLLEELGDGLGVLSLLLDTQDQRLRGLELEEGGPGRHDVAVDVLPEADALIELLGGGDDGTAHGHVVAVIVLGGGHHSEVRTMVKAAGHQRRGESGVTRVEETVLLGKLGHRGDVREGQHGVGRGLGEDELGVRLDVLFDRRDVGEITEGEGDVVLLLKQLAAGTVGASIGAFGDHTVVPGVERRRHQRDRRRHPSREQRGRVTVLKERDALSEGLDGRVLGAGVGEPLLQVVAHGLLHEGRRLHHRGQHSAGRGVRGDTGVNGVGLEPVRRLAPGARVAGLRVESGGARLLVPVARTLRLRRLRRRGGLLRRRHFSLPFFV
eukprot:Hpha_TRINITY_DN16084_c1_g2::TRINITY_DN16084_c1_g2_i1::g.120568::m.120568